MGSQILTSKYLLILEVTIMLILAINYYGQFRQKTVELLLKQIFTVGPCKIETPFLNEKL